MATRKRTAAATAIAAVSAGFAAGLVIGGARLVRLYDWTTEWTVDASPADVYTLFNRPEEQDRWWPSMVVERTSGGSDGTPLSVTYRVIQAPSVRRFAPPFVISGTQTDAEQDRRIRTVYTGDLAGVLDAFLLDTPTGGTRIVFHWYVRVCKPMLNLAGYVAAPLFRASHDHVMREGEAGLRTYFAQRAGRAEPGSAAEAPVAAPSEQP
jgi:uncharacterized protein YndB with AHSA1/START domain